MSAATQAADDIAAELNVATNGPGGPWGVVFTAAQKWEPYFSLSPSTGDIPQITTDPVVSVIPDSTPQNSVGTRGLQVEDQNVMIVLQVAVTDDSNATIDPWAALLEKIKDWFFDPKYAHWVGTVQRQRAVAVEVGTYCYRPHLQDFRIYTGALTITMRVWR